MQFKNIAVAALVGLASAQDLSSFIAQIPSCALTCLLQGATTVGCQAVDYDCQCRHASDIQTAVQPCLSKSTCTPDDLATVQKLSVEICQALGADTGPTSMPSAPTSAGYPTMAPSGNVTLTGSPSPTGTNTSPTTGPTAGAADLRAGLTWAGAALIGALAL